MHSHIKEQISAVIRATEMSWKLTFDIWDKTIAHAQHQQIVRFNIFLHELNLRWNVKYHNISRALITPKTQHGWKNGGAVSEEEESIKNFYRLLLHGHECK